MSDDKKKKTDLVDVKDDVFPEIADLTKDESFRQIVAIMPEHAPMLKIIKDSMPEIQRSSSLFYKTQSQFMDNMLTVTANTPIRNLRQILAEMNRTRDALKEAHFKMRKKEIEMEQKKRELESLLDANGKLKNNEDDLRAEMLRVEIGELMSNAETTKGYISGAIRKMTNYTQQYNSIVEKHQLQNFNEAAFEKEEERYHIMKAFEQALCAARSNGGRIDEGNHIYLTQIGINGAHAQFLITSFLRTEQELLNNGKAPTHKAVRDFLEGVADEFQGSSEKLAESKGMKTVTDSALIEKGDQRLLLTKKKED